jgi:hypothetical protein
MPNTPNLFALMSSDLPPLSDASAVEILEFLHELIYRFEACYFGQIRRFYDQQLDLFDNAQPAASAPNPDEDVPF